MRSSATKANSPSNAVCRLCLRPIFPKLIDGRWVVLEKDGTEHRCAGGDDE